MSTDVSEVKPSGVMVRLSQLAFAAGLLVTGCLVLARVIHYSSIGLPTGFDWLLGRGIHYGIWSFVILLPASGIVAAVIGFLMLCFVFSLIPRKAIRATIVVLLTGFIAVADGPEDWLAVLPRVLVGAAFAPFLIFVRREWIVGWDGRQFATTPPIHLAMWLVIALHNVVIDAEFFVFAAAASTLILIWRTPWQWIGLDPAANDWWKRAVFVVLWALVCGGWWLAAPDPEIRSAVVAWSIALLFLLFVGTRWLVGRDRMALALGCCALIQLVARVPASLENGGVLLGNDGYAYSFCELPEHDKLYATVPCDWAYTVTMASDEMRERCPAGYIAEHDLIDLRSQTFDSAATPAKQHVFFDENFSGRFVRLACTPDTVQVTMVHSQIGRTRLEAHIMEFQVEAPSRFEKAVFDGDLGECAVYDRKHDAVFYSSDLREYIFRLDRKTGEVNRNIAASIYGRPWDQRAIGSHVISVQGLHDGRDSIFIAQAVIDSKIFEINRTSFELMASYDPMNGGNHEIAVDDDLDRIWASSMWGVDVLQIPSGETLARIRVGAATRVAAIDYAHGLVFVSSTFTGRLLVIDRLTMEVLGTLPIGVEGRHLRVDRRTEALHQQQSRLLLLGHRPTRPEIQEDERLKLLRMT